LIGVHVLMILHIVQWLITGRTVSPIEPSETMYTLEVGKINSGFVFFSLALLATFIFGRFACGWGCHIVALQDLCTTWLTRIGIRPKPWRTRFLLFAPTLIALYMFVWPTFKREALLPLMKMASIDLPFWMIPPNPRPNFRPAFVVEDFWATFPPWFVAIPFLLVCGFSIVYFLGSKGFCTYGCPYGGFFAPMDRISIGRIVVNDSCNQCGHCTAACDSNVRVHQEVRDFGKIVDPGCMKCLDCVSVCPNDALKFQFALPAIFTKPRTDEARSGKVRRPEYDMSFWDEVWVGFAGFLLFFGFRGLFNHVPLLMAIGIAAPGAFGLWKLVQVIRVPNVRLQSLQLRVRGSIKPAGCVFAACAVLYAGVGFWGFGRDILMLKGDYHDKRVVITGNSVLSATYTPDPAMEAEAKAGIRAYELAGPPSLGGWGWKHDIETPARLAWLYAVSGDLANTEVWARRALEYDRASPDLAMDLLSVMRLQKKPESEIASTAKALLARHPSMHNLRMPLAAQALQAGKPQEARSLLMELARTEEPATPQTYLQAAEMLANVPDIPAARQIVNAGLAAHPEAVALRIAAAMQLIQDGNVAAGKEKLLAVANGSQPPAQEVFLRISWRECRISAPQSPWCPKGARPFRIRSRFTWARRRSSSSRVAVWKRSRQ
jgi:polyferredoxin